MIPVREIIALSIIIFTASAIRAIAGFGLALIAVPLIQFFLPVSDTAVFIAVVNITFSLLYFNRSREHVRDEPLGIMAIWTGVGVAAGTVVLKFVNAAYIQFAWGILIIVIAIILASGKNFGLQSGKKAIGLSGLFGGILAGATGITGPPVAIILSSVGTPKEKFNAIISLFILFAVSYAFIFYLIAGLIRLQVLLLAVSTIPALLAGLYTGHRLVSKISQRSFDNIIYLILILMGLVTLYKSLRGLIPGFHLF